MDIYLLTGILCTMLMFCYEKLKYKSQIVSKSKCLNPTIFADSTIMLFKFTILFMMFIAMTIVLGFRAVSVGTDNIVYKSIFDNIRLGQDVHYKQREPVFYLIMLIISRFTDEYAIVTLVFAALINFFAILCLKQSINPTLTAACYFLFCWFSVGANIVRQILATVILAYCFMSNKRNGFDRFIKFSLIICAGLIHSASFIISLAFIVVKKIKIKEKYWLILIGVLYFMFLIGKIPVRFFISFIYPDYIANPHVDNFMIMANCKSLLNLALSLILLRKYKEDERLAFLMKVMSMMMVVFAIYYLPNLLRLHMYFSFFEIFLIPYFFRLCKTKSGKVVLFIVLFIYLIYNYFMLVLGGEVLPYVVHDFWKGAF